MFRTLMVVILNALFYIQNNNSEIGYIIYIPKH